MSSKDGKTRSTEQTYTLCVRVINAAAAFSPYRNDKSTLSNKRLTRPLLVSLSLTSWCAHHTVKSLEIRLCRHAGGLDSRRRMTKLRYSSQQQQQQQPITASTHDKPYIDNLLSSTTANCIFRLFRRFQQIKKPACLASCLANTMLV